MHLEAGVGRQQAVSYGRILAQIQIASHHHTHDRAPPEILLNAELVLGPLEPGIVVIGIEDTHGDPCLGMGCWSAIVCGQYSQLVAISRLPIQRSTQVDPARVGEDAEVLGHIGAANGIRDIVHAGVHYSVGDPGIVARVQIAGINLNNLENIERKREGGIRAGEYCCQRGEIASIIWDRGWRTRRVCLCIWQAKPLENSFRCQRYEVIL